MSAAEGWDLTVPDNGAELLAELARHGVRPGQRLHVVQTAETVGEGGPGHPSSEPSRRSFDFAGSFSDEPDLSQRTDDYLRQGFGRE